MKTHWYRSKASEFCSFWSLLEEQSETFFRCHSCYTCIDLLAVLLYSYTDGLSSLA